MEIDGVMPQTLCSLVAFPTATFDWFADTYLRPMAILGMVFYTVYILVSLLTSRNWTGKRLFFSSIHAHGAQNSF